MAAPPAPPCTTSPPGVPTLPVAPACASPLPVAAANSQRPPAAHMQIDVRHALRRTEAVRVLVVKVSCSLAPNPARTFPCMRLFMPCPTLIPSLATSTFSAPGHTESRSSSSSACRAALPSHSARLPRRARHSRQQQVRPCLLVRSRACVLLCCVTGRQPTRSCAELRQPRTFIGR